MDGWRAVAILLVLGSHSIYAAGFPVPGLGPVGLLLDGELGVRLFFILSGFIITFLLGAEAARWDDVSLRFFYIRRALRILPIYLGYLLVLAAVTTLGGVHEAASSWFGSVTFTRNFIGRGDSATVHFWSLAIEEQFYLLWPLVFVRFRLWRRLGLALAIIGGVLLLCPLIRCLLPTVEAGGLERWLGPRSPLRYADSIAIGCGLALLARRSPAATRRPLASWTWAGLAAVVFIGQWVIHSSGWPSAVQGLIPLVQGLALGVIVLFSTSPEAGRLHRLLNHPWAVRIGVLSYSLYVWHLLFLSAFLGGQSADWPTHHWTTWWLASALAAYLSYRFLESPFLAHRSRFSRSHTPSPAPA